MEAYQYEEVDKTSSDKFHWKPFLRQVFICSAVWNAFFMTGLCFGTPTVAIPQIRREANSTAAVSDEMASWLSSIFGYSAAPFVFILPALSDLVGRKFAFIIVSVITLGGFILLYCSVTVAELLISEMFQGISLASASTILLMVVTEYTSPKYRGLFLTLKSASFAWGIWAANALGTFLHWKTIGIAGITCSVYNLISIFFWTESPIFLASKQKIDKCITSHRWLKGTDTNSEKELQKLISFYEDLESLADKRTFISRLYSHLKVLSRREFVKPVLLCTVIVTTYSFSGKLVCNLYAIDIIRKITGNQSTAYTGMLILDGVTVAGMYIGCGLAKIFARRTLFLTGLFFGIMFLYSLSVYLYLIKLNVISENVYLSISLLSGFFMSVSLGPMNMASSLYSEILPLKDRPYGFGIIGAYFTVLQALVLKFAPYFFEVLYLHGTFLFFGIICTICLVILYKYLPETKDKTLLEIADSLKRKPDKV